MDPLAVSNNDFSHIYGWDKLSKEARDKVKYFLRAFSVNYPPDDGTVLSNEIELSWSVETLDVSLVVDLDTKRARLSVWNAELEDSSKFSDGINIEFQVD